MPRYAVFEVKLDKAATAAVSVAYATVDGTAKAADGDYVAKSGTINFAAGEIKKELLVEVRPEADDDTRPLGSFTVSLSSPTGGTLGTKRNGTASLPGTDGEDVPLIPYLDRFDVIYTALHNPDNEYFGPQDGPTADQRTLPKHVSGLDSLILNEAPDYSGETVSETASFWVGLEAWHGYVSHEKHGDGDWSGYNNCWQKIDKYYIPAKASGNMAVYDVDKPADYIPNANLPSLYPGMSQINAPVGVDPLWNDLQTTYGNPDRMYQMHWILDVEGYYGFHNRGGGTKNVFINTYQRGLQESSFETITQGTWNDWKNGGGPYGFEPLFTKGKQVYPEAPFDYGQKWSYTSAPDAEIRTIQWAFWAQKFATEQGKQAQIATSHAMARKMGDYGRYMLFDKYFRIIGDNQKGTKWTDNNSYASCHFLVNWYVSWGGEIVPANDPAGADRDPYYNFLVSCSECHQGYQGVIAAYALATGGGGMAPQSPGSGDAWKGSLYRQIEMIRWLQSPEGPIAGGVTNSMFDQYAAVTDGRQTARFYGMDYVYSPVWHDPVSNNWVGFQGWGQGRTADLFLEVSDKTTPLAVEIRPNLEIILDRLVGWFLKEIEYDGKSFNIPSTIGWTSPTRIVGETIDTPNLEGVYEYKPTLNWNGQQNGYAAFWNASSVPNPTLHCHIIEKGKDLGVAASMAYLLLAYAKAKRNMGKFTTNIPNSNGLTPRDAYVAARRLLDRGWKHWDGIGIAVDEPRTDYDRMADTVYVPPQFSGKMPNGDDVKPGATFISIRTFLKEDPKWPEVEAYINGTGPAPVFRYHRFWAQAEFAIACAAMHKYFGDYIETDTAYTYELPGDE